jgi:hypothetical protein
MPPKPPRPAAREGADRAVGSEFLRGSSSQQNNQLSHSGQDTKRPRNTHIFARAAHDLYIESATVLRATAEPAA